MFSWDLLIDDAALASLLPGKYAHLALPIREALVLFLSQLPQARQQDIIAAQMQLPHDASLSRRLGRLAQCCPVLHKLGQILARDTRLAESLRDQLELLESMPPSISEEVIAASLAEELGPLEKLGVTLLPPAIAEASVGVVIPFAYHAPHEAQLRQGVFKLLKPGIEQRMQQELELLEDVGRHLDQCCDRLQIPALDYQDAFAQVRDKLQYEVRLEDEQRHLAQARKTYADDDRVVIPEVLPFCTPRVTAMERVFGCKITEHARTHRREKRQLAELVVESLVAEPIFARNRQAVFHADPHAGNLLLTADGRLAILDWSLVGTLGQRERIAIVQLLLGAVTLNATRIIAVVEQLADKQRLDRPALERIVQQRLRLVRRGQFPGMAWLMGMLDEAVQNARVRLPADLLLFRKSLHALDGVAHAIGGQPLHMDEVLGREFLVKFAVEWPARWFTLPLSHDFATHVSNFELWTTLLSMPAAATRFWCGHAKDLLGTCQRATRVRSAG